MGKSCAKSLPEEQETKSTFSCSSANVTECGCAEAPTEPCCPPPPADCHNPDTELSACCPAEQQQEQRAGYNIYSFVSAWQDTPVGKVPQVTSKLGWPDRRGRWAMRWGFGRVRYQITPGLYAVGCPNGNSPLLVSANYKLSFDCLRSSLVGENLWILVIDTKGVNVWCAAGKGAFGTDEIVRRCKQVRLEKLLNHRQIIIPQLGAPGVAGYKVKQETGFSVIYGPVRATDLKAFIAAGMQATAEMRQVTFSLWERLILTPVEFTGLYKQLLISCLLIFLLSGIGDNIFSFTAAWQRGISAIAAGLIGVLSGSVLTPILLPWLPTRAFSSKGAVSGFLAASVLALGPYQAASVSSLISLYLLVIAVSSYTAALFTGSSTFTSQSGVEKEMRIAIPCQALSVLIAGLLWITAAF